ARAGRPAHHPVGRRAHRQPGLGSGRSDPQDVSRAGQARRPSPPDRDPRSQGANHLGPGRANCRRPAGRSGHERTDGISRRGLSCTARTSTRTRTRWHMQIGQILRKAILPLVGLSALGALILQIRAPRAAVAAAPVTGASASASGTAASLSGRVRAEGRVAAYPGAEAAVSTEVSGTIARLYVQEKSVVRKGGLIAELSADVERAAAEEARARTGEADADLALLESEVSRQQRLHASGAATAQSLEHAEHDRDAARARRALAAATTRRLASMLKKTRIVAPIDGVVIARLVQPGETVAGGTHL